MTLVDRAALSPLPTARWPRPRPPWTVERVEMLLAMSKQQRSASEIAIALSKTGHSFTRNAVCGQRDRMGIRLGQKKPKPNGAPRPRKPRKPRMRYPMRAPDLPQEPIPDELPAEAIPPRQRRTLLELCPHHCRWPYGDPREPDFFFCGGVTVDDKHSYCACHQRESTARRTVNVQQNGIM